MVACITAELVSTFLKKYLNWETGSRQHYTIVFFDSDDLIPEEFYQAFDNLPTKFIKVDSRNIRSQKEILQDLYSPNDRYISIFDLVTNKQFDIAETAVKFSEIGKSLDFTSFEFPRYELTKNQVTEIFYRTFADDPFEQLRKADIFYNKLEFDKDYRIEIFSSDYSRKLEILGNQPWIEIAGPLREGDNRFLPGAELFYSGENIKGSFLCEKGGLNLLPLRSTYTDIILCKQLIDLSKELKNSSIELEIDGGKILDIKGPSSLANSYKKIFQNEIAFTQVVEVGIGLNPYASPLIYDWPATTNEALPGVHIGLGADPSSTHRFETNIHVDFVCPNVIVKVNGREIFKNGEWLY